MNQRPEHQAYIAELMSKALSLMMYQTEREHSAHVLQTALALKSDFDQIDAKIARMKDMVAQQQRRDYMLEALVDLAAIVKKLAGIQRVGF